MNRRSFLSQASLGLAGLTLPAFVPRLMSAPPSERVRLASIGGGGMAAADLSVFSALPQVDVVAIAEVDATHAALIQKTYPKAKIYADWRELLDKEQKNLDCVNVGIPDHMHGPTGMSAMQCGLHLYMQKPLAHDVFEVRRMSDYAQEHSLVTQMGIQIHSTAYYQLGVALIQGGAIGKVKEVHAWSNKKWGDESPMPDRKDEVPQGLDWDKWLGVREPRPFLKGTYHPGDWRKRLDFGTGTFGDMGCHILDPVFAALELKSPLTVRSEGPMPNAWSWANNAIIHYVFPGTPHTLGDKIEIHWYDGDERPSQAIQEMIAPNKWTDQGSVFIGEKGVMQLPHVAAPVLLPLDKFAGYSMPKVKGIEHQHEFILAVQGQAKTSTPFSYSGPLTEAVLLGGVSTFFPKQTLEWDQAKLAFSNQADAAPLIRRSYRTGWEVKGMA